MKENSREENKNSNFSIEAKFESMIKMAKEIISQNKEGTGDCSIETSLAYDVANYLNKVLKNSISKEKVEEIIDRIDYDIKKTKEIISSNRNTDIDNMKNDYQIVRLRAMNTKSLDIKNRLQKLLESEE